jgi:hypothetical protein
MRSRRSETCPGRGIRHTESGAKRLGSSMEGTQHRGLTTRGRARAFGRILRLAVFAVLGLVASLGVGEREAGAEIRSISVPLTLHVATHDGRPVISRGRILAAVRRANLAFSPYGIQVTVRDVELLPPGHTRLKGARARYRLARRARRDGSVHIFFVDRVALFNPGQGDRRVSGMHWRYRGLKKDVRRREYVAVARDAPTTTLAHEIGHAFGLSHVRANSKLMCSCRRGPMPRFNRGQGTRMRGGARRFLTRSRTR